MSRAASSGPTRRAHEPAAALWETAILAGSGKVPVRIAVIGEFNSGKTSLVNSLLGASLLPTSFTTHTAYPTLVRFAVKPS